MLDFTNIFEISISIVTAMMGLSYPLFLDKVNGIGNYSAPLTRKCQKSALIISKLVLGLFPNSC